jgi:hypothetical protein
MQLTADKPKNTIRVWLITVMSMASIFSILMMAVRAGSAVSFVEPFQVQTSGFEAESYFAIWKYIHDLTVFPDPTQIPFAASYFNWLFYHAYGAGIGAALVIFNLSDAWIPVVSHTATMAVAMVGTILAYTCFRCCQSKGADQWLVAAAFAVLVFLGPLTGFWSMTLRPDVAALAFEVAAILVFMKLYPRIQIQGVLIFSIVAFAAWSLKQTYITAYMTVGLFLLFHRHWVPLGVLIASGAAMLVLTVVIGGSDYLDAILLSGATVEYGLDRMLRNVANVAVKTAPIVILMMAFALFVMAKRLSISCVISHPGIALGLCGTAANLLLYVPLSAQLGAAENYFFPLAFYGALTVVGLLALEDVQESLGRGLAMAAAGGWTLQCVALAYALSGGAVLSVAAQNEKYNQLQTCISQQSGRVFVAEQYGSLPWINRSEPHFVLAYFYPQSRAAGIKFEAGGIKGLIEEGTFDALFLPIGAEAYDDAQMTKYIATEITCAGFGLYKKRPYS